MWRTNKCEKNYVVLVAIARIIVDLGHMLGQFPGVVGIMKAEIPFLA
jgi:hypothetical protein